DDEIWDEFQWEVHLKEMEQRNEQLRDFFTSGLPDDKPRWLRLLNEYNSKLDVMNAYIEEELLIEESYFPDDEDWEDEEEDDNDPFFSMFDEDDELDEWEDFFEDSEEEEGFLDDDGEEWKRLSDDFAMSDYGAIENLSVYLEARSVGAELLKLAETEPHYFENEEFTNFISKSLLISAKLAVGYSFGFEIDVLGANIVYCKKALGYANASLEMLQNLKNKELMDQSRYYEVHQRLFELRNEIGIYIQDLRERFKSQL
ncbi:MAG: hypothetical protein WED82_03320, partial [Balneolales bacterium]